MQQARHRDEVLRAAVRIHAALLRARRGLSLCAGAADVPVPLGARYPLPSGGTR